MEIRTIGDLINALETLPLDAEIVIQDADEECELDIEGILYDKRTGRYRILSDYLHRTRDRV